MTTELKSLARRADGIEGRPATRLQEVHRRIDISRRRRKASFAAGAVGLAGATAVTAIALRTSESRLAPTQDPTPSVSSPTPTSVLEVPDGQETIPAHIKPGDIRGWELRGSRTNADADGATDVSLTVQTGGLTDLQSHVVTFCHGTPDTWWVLKLDLGGVDGAQNADGSMQNGSRAPVRLVQ